MKKLQRAISLFLAICTLLPMLPVTAPETKAASVMEVSKTLVIKGDAAKDKSPDTYSDALTYQDVTDIVNDYYKTVTKNGTAFWNKGIRGDTSTKKLKTMAFLDTVTNASCKANGTASSAGHSHDKYKLKGCSSNVYKDIDSGATSSQCKGFANYMAYVVFGARTKDYSGKEYGSSLKDYKIKPGDYIRFKYAIRKKDGTKTYSYHSVFVYKVDAKNAYTIECNKSSEGGFCQIYKRTRELSTLKGYITSSSGDSYIYRSPATETVTVYSDSAQAYMSQCTEYKSYLTLEVTTGPCYVKELPCSQSTSEASGDVCTVAAGTFLTAVALTKNSEGNYWYKVRTNDGKTGYVHPTYVKIHGVPNDMITSAVSLATTTPKKGNSVNITGSVSSDHLKITKVVGTLKDATGATYAKTATSSFSNIKSSAINKLSFGKLSRGPGTLTIDTTADCYTSEDGKTLSKMPVTKTQVINFTVKETYSVIYDANGGTNAPAKQSKTAGTNLVLTRKTPSREGVTFLGWATTSDATEAEYLPGGTLSKDVYSGNMKLYAVWSSSNSTYTIRFNANGGLGTMDDIDCYFDSSYVLPQNTFEKVNYRFAGWNTSADGSGTLYADGATVYNLTSTNLGTVTLYAQWTREAEDVMYLIIYDANGGLGVMENTPAIVGEPGQLLRNAYSLPFYKFTGWNTEQDGSGIAFEDGATFLDLATTADAEVRLYAQWEWVPAGSYTLHYDGNGSTSGTMASVTATMNEFALLDKNAYTRFGYTFVGWNTAADGSGTSYEDEAVYANLASAEGEEVTLYAQWEPIADFSITGTCGEDLTWSLTADGTLTISGTGPMSEEIQWTDYVDNVKSVVIEYGVTTISELAFHKCQYAESIEIPDTVETIGDGAFGYCAALKSLAIPASVTTIGQMAFFECTGLESITLPENLSALGSYTFWGCESLTEVTVPAEVTDVGYAVFASCTQLESVTFEGSAPVFDSGAFTDSSTSVYYPVNDATWTEDMMQDYGGTITWVPLGEAHTHTEEQLLEELATCTEGGLSAGVMCSTCGEILGEQEDIPAQGHSFDENGVCSGCGTIEVDNTITGSCGEDVVWSLDDEGILTISGTGPMTNYADSFDVPWFNETSSVTCVVIEPGVTSIGDYAFYGFWNMTDVTIPDTVTSIGYYAFYSCEGLTEITIPESVTSLDYGAFCFCIGLTSVTIPDSVEYIGAAAFASCYRLREIIIPASVTVLGSDVFVNCGELDCVYFGGNAPDVGSEIFTDLTVTAFYPVNDTTWTEYRMQKFGGTITWVTVGNGHVPDGTVIENDIAPDCSTDGSYDEVIYCAGCGEEMSRKTVSVIATGEHIDEDGDDSCDICSAATGTTWSLSEDGVLTISGTGPMTDYTRSVRAPWDNVAHTICEIIIEPGVTSIGDYAFYGVHNMYRVSIPDTVTSIGEHAFWYCLGLPTITVPASVTSIGQSAFECCGSLSTITFKGKAPSFGDNVFAETSAIACYPAEDPTWTEDVMQDYGGDVTWVDSEHTHVSGETVTENGMEATCIDPGFYYNVVYCTGCGAKLSSETVFVSATGEHIDEDGDYLCDYGCGTAFDTPALEGSIRIRTATLNLLDKVSIIYKCSDDTIATNDADVAERGILLFDSAEKAATKDPDQAFQIVRLEYNATEARYVGQTEGIDARDMGTSQFAVAYLKMADGTYIFGTKSGADHVVEYSPLKYCTSKKNDATVGALCRAMMHYGAAAQVVQYQMTTGLMNEGFDAIPYDETVLGESVYKADGTTTNGMRLRSMTMDLQGAISYIVKFSVEDTAIADKQLYAEYTLLGETGSVELTEGTDGRMWATISGVAAKDLGATLKVKPYYLDENGDKVYGTELVYSGYEYVRRAQTNANYTEAVKDLAKALAMYISYADAYGN